MPTRSQGTARAMTSAPWSGLPGLLPQWASIRAQGEVTYHARHLYAHVCAVQRGVAALPGPPVSGVQPFLVLPAPHGEGEPVPTVMAVSILPLGGGTRRGRR